MIILPGLPPQSQERDSPWWSSARFYWGLLSGNWKYKDHSDTEPGYCRPVVSGAGGGDQNGDYKQWPALHHSLSLSWQIVWKCEISSTEDRFISTVRWLMVTVQLSPIEHSPLQMVTTHKQRKGTENNSKLNLLKWKHKGMACQIPGTLLSIDIKLAGCEFLVTNSNSSKSFNSSTYFYSQLEDFQPWFKLLYYFYPNKNLPVDCNEQVTGFMDILTMVNSKTTQYRG